MAKNRNEILSQFLRNEKFLEFMKDENIDIESIDFASASESLLAESVKKLIFSYCMDDSHQQVLKKINVLISSELATS